MNYSRFKQNFSPQSPGARSGCKQRRSDALPGVLRPVAAFAGIGLLIPAIIGLASALRKTMLIGSEISSAALPV
jgi:hypothetical protein